MYPQALGNQIQAYSGLSKECPTGLLIYTTCKRWINGDRWSGLKVAISLCLLTVSETLTIALTNLPRNRREPLFLLDSWPMVIHDGFDNYFSKSMLSTLCEFPQGRCKSMNQEYDMCNKILSTHLWLCLLRKYTTQSCTAVWLHLKSTESAECKLNLCSL